MKKMNFEWVDKRDRMPTAKDTDTFGTILAWHVYSGIHITNPAVFAQYNTFLTHWATPPKAPEGAMQLVPERR